MKTYKNWKTETLDNYLAPGDEVDEELVNYIVNCLPPASYTSYCTQLGEPYSSDMNGKALYFTFSKEEGIWTFKGFCRRGEIEHISNYY